MANPYTAPTAQADPAISFSKSTPAGSQIHVGPRDKFNEQFLRRRSRFLRGLILALILGAAPMLLGLTGNVLWMAAGGIIGIVAIFCFSAQLVQQPPRGHKLDQQPWLRGASRGTQL
jgi:hypothetical protein